MNWLPNQLQMSVNQPTKKIRLYNINSNVTVELANEFNLNFLAIVAKVYMI